MKTIIMIIFCLLPTVGKGQPQMLKNYKTPYEALEIANKNLERNIKQLENEVLIYKNAYLAYKIIYDKKEEAKINPSQLMWINKVSTIYNKDVYLKGKLFIIRGNDTLEVMLQTKNSSGRLSYVED